MSVIFVVTPIIVGGWPVITAAASAAAGTLGYKQLKQAEKTHQVKKTQPVTLDVDNVEGLAGGMREDESMTFGNEELRITVTKDARGKVQVHADGKGKSTAELEELGSAFVSRMIRQYAYQKVASQLVDKGFSIVEEEAGENQSIRIRFRKFE